MPEVASQRGVVRRRQRGTAHYQGALTVQHLLPTVAPGNAPLEAFVENARRWTGEARCGCGSGFHYWGHCSAMAGDNDVLGSTAITAEGAEGVRAEDAPVADIGVAEVVVDDCVGMSGRPVADVDIDEARWHQVGIVANGAMLDHIDTPAMRAFRVLRMDGAIDGATAGVEMAEPDNGYQVGYRCFLWPRESARAGPRLGLRPITLKITILQNNSLKLTDACARVSCTICGAALTGISGSSLGTLWTGLLRSDRLGWKSFFRNVLIQYGRCLTILRAVLCEVWVISGVVDILPSLPE